MSSSASSTPSDLPCTASPGETPQALWRTWAERMAPSLTEFDALTRQAFAMLPEPFRGMASSATLHVEDFPSDEVQKNLHAASPYDLMGLFEGTGMAQGEPTFQFGVLPNRITLYRRPILDYWAEYEETLGAVITHVLVHEIGHHFGFSDEDMEKIEGRSGEDGT